MTGMSFQPQDPEYRRRVRELFDAQPVMATLGATLAEVGPGTCTLSLPWSAPITQQDGFLHAGVLATLADSACGFAAYSLMPPGARVLSIEFKINMLSPAVGPSFEACGQVIRAGRKVTACRADVFASTDAGPKLVAAMQATMMTVS
jgi:uncharacterized protein (TIGR00369 family)